MRQIVRSLALVAILALGPGCFVLDELDSGMELMKETSPSARKAAAAKAAAEEEEARAPTRKKEGPQIDVAAWWKKARTPSSGPKDPETAIEVVSCRIGGSVRFMSKTDCQIQGGRF